MSSAALFNLKHLRQQRARSQRTFDQARFLHDHAAADTLERLSMIRRDSPNTIMIGNRVQPDFISALKASKNIQNLTIIERGGDEIEQFPIAENSVDMVISLLDLHTVNDLPGYLIQIRKSLKPDGFFIASFFGGETLFELRQVLMEAELQLTGGASPRVYPFADKQQIGGLLQRAGFALPVVDSEIIRVSYENIFKLMQDVRNMGESNIIAARKKSFTGKMLFGLADQIYHTKFSEPQNRMTASFEIIHAIGWAPHASQPKPLKPGSAEHSLAETLKN